VFPVLIISYFFSELTQPNSGREDMAIEGVWVRRGVVVTSPQEYHL
jgi:hypothetical protein